MPRARTIQTVVEHDWDPEDPRIAGKDPTMVPGHPQCNYEKFLAAQPTADIVMQGDYENRQHKTFTISFNGYQSQPYEFNKTVHLPWPMAAQAMLTGKASTSNAKLLRELEGQIRPPIEGALPGPFSGDYANDKF